MPRPNFDGESLFKKSKNQYIVWYCYSAENLQLVQIHGNLLKNHISVTQVFMQATHSIRQNITVN